MLLVTGPDRLAARRPRSTPPCASSTRPRDKLISIEDPVEYQIDGVTQIQVAARNRPRFRAHPALGGAARSRHHHGRRDPRPGDRGHRRPCGAHRPSPALHPAHQQCRRCRGAPARHGHRALPPGLGAARHRRPASGGRAVQRLQGGLPGEPRGPRLLRGRRHSRRRPTSTSTRQGLRGVRGRGLHRPGRHLRVSRGRTSGCASWSGHGRRPRRSSAAAMEGGMRTMFADGLRNARRGSPRSRRSAGSPRTGSAETAMPTFAYRALTSTASASPAGSTRPTITAPSSACRPRA